MEKNEMGGACSKYGGEERCIQGLVENTEGKRSLGRPRRRWEDNVTIDLQDMGRTAWTRLIYLRIGTGGGVL
jgi:hypothetical protein